MNIILNMYKKPIPYNLCLGQGMWLSKNLN